MTSAALDFPAPAPPASRPWPPLAQQFAALGDAFSVPVAVSPLPDPVLVASSADAAALVGLLAVAVLGRLVAGPTIADRAVALDTMNTLVVGLM
ncbi:MAG TPA: hypothetical protein PLD03_05295, partial [Thiomonas arsenitoxydans]|nr:hypothetical protein [Thiomonas arsenitoxydans]